VFAGNGSCEFYGIQAFLDFPLNGAGGVPGNAVIESAFLDIFISSFQPSTRNAPHLIELVAFQQPTLIETDFDRTIQPPLAYVRVTPPFTLRVIWAQCIDRRTFPDGASAAEGPHRFPGAHNGRFRAGIARLIEIDDPPGSIVQSTPPS